MRSARVGSAAAGGLRAGFDRAAVALDSALDAEQGPVADALATLGTELIAPPRPRWWPSRHRRPQGIYLHGPVGAGKTWLVDVLLDQLPDKLHRRVHVYQAARALHAGIAAHAGQPGALDTAIAGVLDGARLLFLDELHAHDPGDAMILSRMLLALPVHGATLVATSNYPPTGLLPDPRHHRLVLPLVAAIETSCAVIELDAGIDHRAAGHGGARTGFSCGAWATPGSPAQLAALGLRAPDPGDRTRLSVGGRPLWVSSAVDGVLHLRFDELCQRPTSVGDLLELTERYDTLVLAAVPLLGSVNEDARRRFADLVDVAWDRDTRLVVLTTHPVKQVLDAEITDHARMAERRDHAGPACHGSRAVHSYYTNVRTRDGVRMRNHLLSLGIGGSLLVVGLVLWATTQDVQTPVVSLSKTGLVLAVLGALELVITAAALAVPSTRHKNYEL